MTASGAKLVGALAALLWWHALPAGAEAPGTFRRLPMKEYRDKMKAGWIGQMGGVAFGAPTEFKWQGKIGPAAECPHWNPNMVNGAFNQDDLYVEMTFLRTLEEHGFDVSQRRAGIDFARSQYKLWHANVTGRGNLASGIAPPDSSHPRFNFTPYDFKTLLEVSEKLARQALARGGGRIEKDAAGEEVMLIPSTAAKPSELMQSWSPGPISCSFFTPEEMAAIQGKPVEVKPDPGLSEGLAKLAPGWSVSGVWNLKGSCGLKPDFGGKKNVFVTHPGKILPAIISRKAEIPAGKKTFLHLVVAPLPGKDFELGVRVGAELRYFQLVGPKTLQGGWHDAKVDLSDCAGKTVDLAIIHLSNDWNFEHAHWAEIAIQSQ